MERSALSAVVIEELGELFTGALRAVGPALLAADLDGVEQQVQALGRRVLGRVVEAAVAERAATVPDVAPCCARCVQPQRLIDPARVRHLHGLVGDVCAGAGLLLLCGLWAGGGPV